MEPVGVLMHSKTNPQSVSVCGQQIVLVDIGLHLKVFPEQKLFVHNENNNNQVTGDNLKILNLT